MSKKDVYKQWPPLVPFNTLEQRRIYKFSEDPDCIIVRIMSRLFKMKNVTAEIMWEYGFLCGLKEQMAIVEYNIETFSLFVKVRVPTNYRYNTSGGMLLRAIIESIETIIESYYPKIADRTKRFVPCNHCIARNPEIEPYKFTYGECVSAVTSGYPIVYCQGLQSRSRTVTIDVLAPDITFIDFPNIKESELTLDKELGQGSFGTVYSGLWNGEKVAIKTLKLYSDDESSKFWEFQQESFLMSKIDHENLVHMFGVTSNPPMMVMELITGGDLYNLIHPLDETDHLKRNRLNTPVNTYPWELRLKIALDVARGMEYMHNITPSVIHRDLRSPNIFIVSTNLEDKVHAKVADFGLARFLYNDKIAGSLNSWQWLPPEIIKDDGSEYSISADIYGFGIVLWELVTFKYPYDEYQKELRFQRHIVDGNGNEILMLNIPEVKKAIIEERLRPSIPSNCPPVIRNLIEECWQHMPKKRPGFSDIVQRLAGELKVKIEQSSFKKRKSPLMREGNNTPRPQILINERKFTTIVSPYRWFDIRPRYVVSLLYIDALDSIWVGCSDGCILIYDSSNLQQKGNLNAVHHHRISKMILVDLNVWTCSVDGTIQVWDSVKMQRVALLATPGDRYPIKCLCKVGIGMDTHIWSSSPKDRSICIWRPNFLLVDTLELLSSALAIACTKDFVFIGTATGEISVFNHQLYNIGTWSAHNVAVTSITVITENILWSGADNGEITVWDVTGIEGSSFVIKKATRHLQTRAVTSLNIIGKHIWSASSDSTIIIWDIDVFKPLQELTEYHKESIQATLLASHEYVWSTSADGVMVIWKFETDDRKSWRGVVPNNRHTSDNNNRRIFGTVRNTTESCDDTNNNNNHKSNARRKSVWRSFTIRDSYKFENYVINNNNNSENHHHHEGKESSADHHDENHQNNNRNNNSNNVNNNKKNENEDKERMEIETGDVPQQLSKENSSEELPIHSSPPSTPPNNSQTNNDNLAEIVSNNPNLSALSGMENASELLEMLEDGDDCPFKVEKVPFRDATILRKGKDRKSKLLMIKTGIFNAAGKK